MRAYSSGQAGPRRRRLFPSGSLIGSRVSLRNGSVRVTSAKRGLLTPLASESTRRKRSGPPVGRATLLWMLGAGGLLARGLTGTGGGRRAGRGMRSRRVGLARGKGRFRVSLCCARGHLSVCGSLLVSIMGDGLGPVLKRRGLRPGRSVCTSTSGSSF